MLREVSGGRFRPTSLVKLNIDQNRTGVGGGLAAGLFIRCVDSSLPAQLEKKKGRMSVPR